MKTKVTVTTLRELLLEDDCALNSDTEAEMQQCVNRFSRACDIFGFTISTKKTEVMHQPAPRKMYHEPHIFVNDEPLKATDSFTYLGTPSREKPTLTWKSISDFPKPTLHFEDLRRKCRNDEDSAETPI